MATRDVILDAAAKVLRTHGLANATTREIARAAGFSEATLYKHFRDKVDLMVAVLHERGPQFIPILQTLPARAGEGDLRETLTELATVAIGFYRDGFPMFASIFSDPAILGAHRDQLRAQNLGPHRANDALADYLRAERDLGRVRPDADLVAVAALLLGACFQHAFITNFADRRADAEAARGFVAELRL
ncbi:TetR/AcrR family transcriptional regulator [Dactylosporangium sp. AC04546]|uniref:TetR/AcrR family transcriptional regulator n=1 Tax=Dactylosporangium sp. AC04546 TaxID=2862460 RepID=UPI001EDC9609|nr:TetR/AcrR family transcriptional regulator [Dactylosporangium sp. AC04546]WVK86156.1 TetR/AcrR family transcriptional regulator [Dactylosporangium sp. AC04546]